MRAEGGGGGGLGGRWCSDRAGEVREDCHRNDVRDKAIIPWSFFLPPNSCLCKGLAAGSFVIDIVVRGKQDSRKFAGQADQGPVQNCLLLGFDLLRLPPKPFGPQDGWDTPPEPLGRLPLPRLVFGILCGHMLLPWDFLMWRAGENRGKREKMQSVH